METRVDIINITIEELVRLGYELPVFRTLDEISNKPTRPRKPRCTSESTSA